jgi:hypothetical protein
MDDTLYSRKFCFEHESGDLLYPIRIRNLDTGRVAFRVSPTRTIKGKQLEVEEDEMLRRVLDQGYTVRMKCPESSRNGGYRRSGTSIRRVIDNR